MDYKTFMRSLPTKDRINRSMSMVMLGAIREKCIAIAGKDVVTQAVILFAEAVLTKDTDREILRSLLIKSHAEVDSEAKAMEQEARNQTGG